MSGFRWRAAMRRNCQCRRNTTFVSWTLAGRGGCARADSGSGGFEELVVLPDGDPGPGGEIVHTSADRDRWRCFARRLGSRWPDSCARQTVFFFALAISALQGSSIGLARPGAPRSRPVQAGIGDILRRASGPRRSKSALRLPELHGESRAAIVLHRHGTIAIMKACKLFSRRRVAKTACAVLPAPGIVA